MNGMLSSLFSSGAHTGIFVSDASIRYASLKRNGKGFELDVFGTVPLEAGVILHGRIQDADRFVQALRGIKKRIKLSRAHVAVAIEDFAESPLAEWEQCFRKAGIAPLSIETEREAATRAVVRAGDPAMHLVVDASALGDDVSRAAAEIDRHLVHRYVHAESAPESLILVGEGAGRTGLAERLSAALRIQVVPGEVWTNLLLPAEGVPKLPRSESYAYAGAIGAALKN